MVAAALLAAVLGGCYLPARFDAEIEISRRGFYKIVFDGYLVEITLYDGLRTGEITQEQEAAKVKLLETDITRDSAVSEFKYIEQGHFKVHWEKSGDLLRSKMVTFVRRNENIIGLKYVNTTGDITMTGKNLGKAEKKQLIAMGLGMQGQLRLKTDANVTGHNATRVIGKDEKIYIWDIKDIHSPAPKLTISLY